MNCAYYEALMQVQQQTIAVIRENALYRHKNNKQALEVLDKKQITTSNVIPHVSVKTTMHLLSATELD